MEKVDNRLHENIRILRALKGFTQKKLAAEFDILQSYYSRIERGIIDPPSTLLRKISEFYHVSVDSLIYTDLTKDVQIMTEKKK